MRKPPSDLAEKVAAIKRAQALGKKHYAKADRLTMELALELDCGVAYRISPKKFVVLTDSEKDGKILCVAYARRYELKFV